jgi:dephospho-CoA kinase
MNRVGLRVGVTGGIAAGKSEVSARLATLGAVVIDADVLAREVVEPGTPALAEVVVAFGPAVLGEDGRLDRAVVGAQVFADPSARRRLESIIHPRVRARAAELEAQAPAGAVVVHDIPLLVESGQTGDFDAVVVVECPPRLQLRRLMSHRGLTSDEAAARIAAQADPEQRRAVADYVIDNRGSLELLDRQVSAVWRRLTAQQTQSRTGREEPVED